MSVKNAMAAVDGHFNTAKKAMTVVDGCFNTAKKVMAGVSALLVLVVSGIRRHAPSHGSTNSN